MTSVTISLPEDLTEYIEQAIVKDGSGTISDYFQKLVREDLKKRSREKLDHRLLEGLNSEISEMTESDWNYIHKTVRDRYKNAT